MKQGFDYNADLSPTATCLAQNGFTLVGRYYNINNPAKNLTLPEAKVLSQAGLNILVLWENGFPRTPDYFSTDQGTKDANAAIQYASTVINQPGGTPIYFTVDYDALPADVNGVITQYFQAIQAAFTAAGNTYLIGAYGSGLVCATLQDANLAVKFCLAQSPGWAGHDTYNRYDVAQALPTFQCNITAAPLTSPNDTEGSFQVPF
jgi:Domain of unknown function (DUF1906)